MELLVFIFQDHQFLPYMHIGDQLQLVAKLKGEKDKAQHQAEVRSITEHLGIETSYTKYPSQISAARSRAQRSLTPSSTTQI